jgi:hypothetical protein
MKLEEQNMSDLVNRLCIGDHPVEVTIRPERTLEAFKACLGRSYTHIKFTNTRGGTELGVRIDPALSDFTKCDLDNQTGTMCIAGTLTLDYVKVRCMAEIDLATFKGSGHLERVEEAVAV